MYSNYNHTHTHLNNYDRNSCAEGSTSLLLNKNSGGVVHVDNMLELHSKEVPNKPAKYFCHGQRCEEKIRRYMKIHTEGDLESLRKSQDQIDDNGTMVYPRSLIHKLFPKQPMSPLPYPPETPIPIDVPHKSVQCSHTTCHSPKSHIDLPNSVPLTIHRIPTWVVQRVEGGG